jgi:hypothetical protein
MVGVLAAIFSLLAPVGSRAAAHGIRECGSFVGPTWHMYGHTGMNYSVHSWGISCSLAKSYARSVVGTTVKPWQLRQHIAYPKYVLTHPPKGFTCWVETTPTGLDEIGHVIEGKCSKGPLPPYTSNPSLGEFSWGAIGG